MDLDTKIRELVKAEMREGIGEAFATYRVLPNGEIKKADLLTSEEKGRLEQAGAGILAPITQVEVFGMPLGQAAVGGGIALFASELIDAFITKPATGIPMTRVLVKGVAGFAMVQFLSGPLGSDAAKVAAMFLGFSLLRDLLPIDDWIGNLVKGIKGKESSTSSSSSSGGSSSSTSSGSNGHSSPDAMAMLRAAAGR
jgi:hypothetical protein